MAFDAWDVSGATCQGHLRARASALQIERHPGQNARHRIGCAGNGDPVHRKRRVAAGLRQREPKLPPDDETVKLPALPEVSLTIASKIRLHR